jgi:hypothetical protein
MILAGDMQYSRTSRIENRLQNATIYKQLHQRQKFSSNTMTDICKGMGDPIKIIGYADDWIKYLQARNYQDWQKSDLKKQRTKSLNGLMKMDLEYPQKKPSPRTKTQDLNLD